MKKISVTLVLLIAALPLAAQTKYVVNDLGSLGGDRPAAQAINNAGQVAGYGNLTSGGPNHAFRTSPNSAINPSVDDLGLLGGISSSASGINNLGQVAATVRVGALGPSYAVLIAPDGTYQNLGDMGGAFPGSNANAINDSGQLTGSAWATVFCGSSHAFLTAANSALNASDDLGTLRTGNCGNSVGLAINSSGQVAGYSAVQVGLSIVQHAALWTPGSGITDLGVLGGDPTVSFFGVTATAYGINNDGQVVGSSSFNHDSSISPFFTHAFLTTAAGPMHDIGTLGGHGANANGINNLGQIVGNSTVTNDTAQHGFVYNSGTGVMTDLNTAIVSTGYEVLNASAINDKGQIVACARLTASDPPFGCTHSVRLDPPGEASSALITQLSSPSLGLTSGQISSLTDKLNNAILSIQRGLNGQAIKQLNAFTNSVQSSVKTGKITTEAGATLISEAQAIIATLS
jgi:probable HAF family extracellular repeat protein